jgi:hypothetical protein
MNTPEIQALGIIQDHFSGRWKATGYVEGIGWLEAWGKSLIEAMETLQRLAAQRAAELTASKQTNVTLREVEPIAPPSSPRT